MDNPFQVIQLQLEQLSAKIDNLTAPTSEQVLNVEQAAEFTGLAKSTIYQYVGARTIPHSKIGGKNVFLKSELIEWIKVNSKATVNELSKTA